MVRWVVGLVVLGGMGLGCARDGGAALCESDRRDAQAVLAKDRRVAGVLHEADVIALAGRPLDAAGRIEKDARGLMGEAVSGARSLAPRTRWGDARAKDLVALTEQRRGLIDSYAAALRSEDLGRVLEQMEKQRDLEKRAVEVENSLRALPDLASGLCNTP